MERFKPDYLLPLSIFVAGVLISASILYTGGTPSKNTPAGGDEGTGGEQVAGTVPVISKDDVVLGDENAPVSFIEFGDYQCPFCARVFKQVEPQVKKNYVETGKVKMVFRNLAFLGPESVAAAEAAACAKEQGKFWEFHNGIYEAENADGKEHNGNLSNELFMKLARNFGLDEGKFESCITGRKYSKKIEADNEAARGFGVESTPTTFINGKMVVGAVPYAEFQKEIEAALKAK